MFRVPPCYCGKCSVVSLNSRLFILRFSTNSGLLLAGASPGLAPARGPMLSALLLKSPSTLSQTETTKTTSSTLQFVNR